MVEGGCATSRMQTVGEILPGDQAGVGASARDPGEYLRPVRHMSHDCDNTRTATDMSRPPAPSNAELELLKCLWRNGTCSARELHDSVAPLLDWSYSSTRKTLERMVDKGLVGESSSHGLNVYRAKIGKVATLAALSADFARRVLEIEGPLPAQAFADSRLLNEDEIEQLQALLRDNDKEDQA